MLASLSTFRARLEILDKNPTLECLLRVMFDLETLFEHTHPTPSGIAILAEKITSLAQSLSAIGFQNESIQVAAMLSIVYFL